MTNKEAITYLEWLSDIDFTKEYPKYPIVTKKEQVEALQMAITALDQLDNNSTKPDNSNLTQSNGIESKVKGITACRVPEDDTIRRQAAIDIFDDYNVSVENGELEAYSRDRKRLCDLPPVQPLVIHCTDCEDWLERQSISGFSISELPSAQPEIIRCKDCKWHSKEYYCLTTGKWGYGDNDFCSYAERRTDE